jgi:hypothetical protein
VPLIIRRLHGSFTETACSDPNFAWLWESAFFADFHSHHQRQRPLKKVPQF